VIVDAQPAAFFPLLANPARLVRAIEKQMLWTILAIQISQQHDPGIGECLNDMLPHDRLANPDINSAVDAHRISTN